MSIVLAALDTSATARPVLTAALGIGELTGAAVEAVHVHDGPADTPESLATRSGVPLRVLPGPVERALLRAMAEPEVIIAVIGARATPGGRRPVGRTALHLLERVHKPMVVVPPEVAGSSPRPFRRLLVPLEGTEASSQPIADVLRSLLATEVEVVVLHVFTPSTAPRILDRPVRDLQLLGDEFLARHYPDASHIELRSGPVGSQVAAMCAEEAADLVVLSWSQDSSAGRAPVIREVLGRCPVPVLLLPVAGAGADLDDGRRAPGQPR